MTPGVSHTAEETSASPAKVQQPVPTHGNMSLSIIDPRSSDFAPERYILKYGWGGVQMYSSGVWVLNTSTTDSTVAYMA